MNGMGQRICWVSGGKVIFALGDGELFRDHALDGSAARDYAEGKAARSRQGKRLIELQGEFNPDEITEEDHRKYEAGKAEAEGGTSYVRSLNRCQQINRRQHFGSPL